MPKNRGSRQLDEELTDYHQRQLKPWEQPSFKIRERDSRGSICPLMYYTMRYFMQTTACMGVLNVAFLA